MTAIATADFSRVMRVSSLALGYPDAGWRDDLALVAAATEVIGRSAREPLRSFLDEVGGQDDRSLQQAYVDTFDLRRKCCPYLTYYSFGDTRKRGMALLQFTAAYRGAGFELTGGELPDHLAVVCEFAAGAPERGRTLLRRHRAGLELLRTALVEARSVWRWPVDAIRAVLPDAAPRDVRRALDLARTGPPTEEVGLEPFAPPEYMGGRR
jgi:nitrate reductase molybdenum cofactor assembly chaperone NarJ/NarW